LNRFLPLPGPDGTPWQQSFLNELPYESREIVATVLKHKSGGKFLTILSKRARAANTAADLAYLVGESVETLEPLLNWLHVHGILESLHVEGTTFYKLTDDEKKCRHVHLFRERRAKWLEQMQRISNWLEGKHQDA
jgi:hypothetical protein